MTKWYFSVRRSEVKSLDIWVTPGSLQVQVALVYHFETLDTPQ